METISLGLISLGGHISNKRNEPMTLRRESHQAGVTEDLVPVGTLHQYMILSDFGVMEVFNKGCHSELGAWRLAISVVHRTVKTTLTGTVLYPALIQGVRGSSMLWDQQYDAEPHTG